MTIVPKDFPNADIIKVVSTARNTEPRDDIISCCKVCGQDIQVMAFKGTGVCGENHRKITSKAKAAMLVERIERAKEELIQ